MKVNSSVIKVHESSIIPSNYAHVYPVKQMTNLTNSYSERREFRRWGPACGGGRGPAWALVSLLSECEITEKNKATVYSAPKGSHLSIVSQISI